MEFTTVTASSQTIICSDFFCCFFLFYWRRKKKNFLFAELKLFLAASYHHACGRCVCVVCSRVCMWSLAESTTFNFISFTLTIIITSLRHRCSSTYWHRIHLRADRWMALSWRRSLCVVLITWCTVQSTVAVWLTRCRRWWRW